MALQSIAGDPLYCHMHTLIFWWIILYSTADVASSLLMFDAEGLVPCLLQQVLPLILNHADAETILGDPKVCTKKYYCYSYFKSPFTDKNNLTKDLWPEQRCSHHLREKTPLLVSLSLDAVTTKGHSLQHQWKILPVTMISYIPLDKKKNSFKRKLAGVTASVITIIRHDSDMTVTCVTIPIPQFLSKDPDWNSPHFSNHWFVVLAKFGEKTMDVHVRAIFNPFTSRVLDGVL